MAGVSGNRIALGISRHLILIVLVIAVLCTLASRQGPTDTKLDVAATRARSRSRSRSADAANLSDHVLVLTQISDIHITTAESRATERFRQFTTETLPVIRPRLVVVSGDIADSQDGFFPLATESQWILYKQIRENSSYATEWAETLGNHCAYGVVAPVFPGLYTASGPDIMKPVRTISVNGSFGEQSFILLRSTVDHVLWASFVGGVSTADAALLRSAIAEEAAKQKPVIVVGHHPPNWVSVRHMTSDVLSAANSGASSMSFYLSGHCHMNMYARHPQGGTLEFSVKALRMGWYRVLVIDNGLMSFTDTELGRYPVVVLTYPKPALMISKDEPLFLMEGAQQIRCAVFSRVGVQSVSASVDGTVVCPGMQRVENSSLFSCPWDSSSAATGLHAVTIRVVEADGNVGVLTRQISLSGDIERTTGRNTAILRFKGPRVLFGLWLLSAAITFILAALPRVAQPLLRAIVNSGPRVASVDKVFGPVSSAWIAAVEEGNATIDQYIKAENLSIPQRIVLFLTWEFQQAIWEYSRIPLLCWIFVCALWAFAMFLPLVIKTYADTTVVCFAWGTVDTAVNGFYHNEQAMFLSWCFLMGIVYPVQSLLSSLEIVRRRPKKVPRVYDFFLAVLMLVTTVGCLVWINITFSAIGIVTSPISYVLIVADVFIFARYTVVLLIATHERGVVNVVQPKEHPLVMTTVDIVEMYPISQATD